MDKLTTVALLAASVSAAPALAHDDGRLIPGQLALITLPGVSLDDVRAAHPGLSLANLRNYTPPGIYLVGVPVGQEDAYQAELVADVARIRVAEENRTMSSPEEGTTQSLFLRTGQAGYRGQEALGAINFPPTGRRPGAEGPLVAVLDTGIAPHPDLHGRIAAGGYNFVNDTPASDESACPAGSHLVGHGTFAAGLIALVDPDARFLPITVLDCDGVGSAFAVACGIYESISRGAVVVNMSFATILSSDVVETAVNDAVGTGVVCVSSVSNGARDTDNIRVYPAAYDAVIGVGAVTRSAGVWSRAPFSDWGRLLEITAPGIDITSLRYDGTEFGYSRGSGTSYSAALVTGVLSRVRDKYGPRSAGWIDARLCDSALPVNLGEPVGMGCEHSNDGIAAVIDAGRAICPADFNADEFVDFHDFDTFVGAFESGAQDADFNGDGFADFFDFSDFVTAFEAGC